VETNNIHRAILGLLPSQKSNQFQRPLILWPENVKIMFKWKDFLKSYKEVNNITSMYEKEKKNIQEKFFYLLITQKHYEKNNTYFYNLFNHITYKWIVYFDTKITKELETGEELLKETTLVGLYCSGINEKRPWFKYTFIYQKPILKEKLIDSVKNLMFELMHESMGKSNYVYELHRIYLDDFCTIIGHSNNFKNSKLSLIRKIDLRN
jgi:hypothetical protein